MVASWKLLEHTVVCLFAMIHNSWNGIAMPKRLCVQCDQRETP